MEVFFGDYDKKSTQSLEKYLLDLRLFFSNTYKNGTNEDKKVLMCNLIFFNKDSMNIQHDFIEYDENLVGKMVTKPQWFHSASAIYLMCSVDSLKKNSVINMLLESNLKNKLLEMSKYVMCIDPYGEQYINILKENNNYTMYDTHNNKTTDFDK